MDTKIRCVLIDDELPGLQYLKALCLQIPYVDIIRTFNRPEKLLAEKDQLSFDLALMDIEMPGLSGMQLARELNCPVIFTTAYKEYAAEAFEIQAIDYLVKPISRDRLHQAFERARLYLQAPKAVVPVSLNTDKGKAIIDFDKVAVITTSPVDPRDKEVLFENSEVVTLKNYSFESVNAYTAAAGMVRINKAQLVASRLVRIYTQNQVSIQLQDESLQLSLGGAYRAGFLLTIGG